MEDDAAKDTESKIAEIKKIGKGKGGKVVDDLLKAVMEVTPEVPDNLKPS
jgi:V-type H+-transporting ATPase subunit G